MARNMTVPDFSGLNAQQLTALQVYTVALQQANDNSSNTAGNTTGGTTIGSIVCHNCGVVITLPDPENRWYAIWVSKQVGWVHRQTCMQGLVNGISRNEHQYFETEAEAQNTFLAQHNTGTTRVVGPANMTCTPLAPSLGTLIP